METLASRIARQGALNTTDAVGWLVRLARSIERLHARNAVHGRISPHCLLIETGDCTSAGHLAELDKAPELLAYHSPERTIGVPGAVSDDTWALAATLFEALTGKPAFQGATDGETRSRIASTRPILPETVGVRAEKIQAILDRAFSREWLERTRDVSTLRLALEALRPDIRFAALPPLEESNKPKAAAAGDDGPAISAKASVSRRDEDAATVNKQTPDRLPAAFDEDDEDDEMPTSVAERPAGLEIAERPRHPQQKPPLAGSRRPAAAPKEAPGVNFKALRDRLRDPAPGAARPATSAHPSSAPEAAAPVSSRAAPESKRSAPVSVRSAPVSSRFAPAPEAAAPASVRSAPVSVRSAPVSSRFAPAASPSAPAAPPSAPAVPAAPPSAPAVPAAPPSAPIEPAPPQARREWATPDADSHPTIQVTALRGTGHDSEPTMPGVSLFDADARPALEASLLLEAEPETAQLTVEEPDTVVRSAPSDASPAPRPAANRRPLLTHTELLAVPMPLPPMEEAAPASPAPPAPASVKGKPAPEPEDAAPPEPRSEIEDMVPPEPRPSGMRRAAPPRVVPFASVSGARQSEPAPSRRGARTALLVIVVVLIAGAAAAGTVALLRTKFPSVRLPGLGGPKVTATESAAPPAMPGVAIPAPQAAASEVGAAPSASAAEPEPSASADASAAPTAGASAVPSTPGEINACLRLLFASDTFLPDKMPDFSGICAETEPRRGGALLKKEVVRASGGRVSEGMREWAMLGWYEMAAFAVMRTRCCPSPAPLKLPDAAGPCDPLDQRLNELGASVLGTTDTNDAKLKTAMDQYTKSVHCAVRMGTTGNFPWKDQLQGGEDTTFLKTLVRAVGSNQ